MAGVREYDFAGLFEILDQLNAVVRSAQQFSERGLAVLQRLDTHVVAVELEQVEAEQLHFPIMPPGVQPVEVAEAIFLEDDALTVEHE